jgi:rod shape-determining protein MreD
VTVTNWARLLLVGTIGVIAQVAVVDQVLVRGYHADLMILLAIAAGLIGGPQRGGVAGFVLGLFADLVLPTPYGLSSLTFVLVGFSAGMLRGSTGEDSFAWRVLLCVVGGALGTLVFAAVGGLIGQPGMLGRSAIDAVLVVGAGGLVLAWPAVFLMRWALSLEPGAGERRSMPSGGSATTAL